MTYLVIVMLSRLVEGPMAAGAQAPGRLFVGWRAQKPDLQKSKVEIRRALFHSDLMTNLT